MLWNLVFASRRGHADHTPRHMQAVGAEADPLELAAEVSTWMHLDLQW